MPKSLILAVLLLPAAWGQDFSGSWKLVSQNVTTGALPEPAPAALEIEQSAARIRCTAISPDDVRLPFEFTLDGHESTSMARGARLSTIGKWEGQALLLNTIVSSPHGNYTQMDRWRVSAGGARLTILREIVRRSGSAEARLVYERPARAAVPARPEPIRPAVPSQPAPVAPPPAVPEAPEPPAPYRVEAGTHIPLTLINSVSTKQSAEGDRLYLSTAFPIVIDGRVVIPPGSYVAGTLTFVKRPGRVHGRGELYLRFDSLTLPSGLTREFRARAGGLDGEASGRLDRKEGKVEGDGGKGTDARTIGEATAAGASIGAITGAAADHTGMGVGTGAAAGAIAGVAAVLLSRGPDIVLARGTTLELVLDRTLVFTEEELSPSWRRVH